MAQEKNMFLTRVCFSGHIKTKTHTKWLSDLNANKINYFTENIKLNEIISNQKLVIARLQRENDENIKMIAHLTKKIEMKEHSHLAPDLLTFD